MAENKNQHYVPRVYLKSFTLDGSGLAINLLTLDRLMPIQNAPVKNQCSGNYFYGKDQRLESAINSVENPYGEAARWLVDSDGVINSAVRVAILRFIYLQYLRTEAASRRAAEMTIDLHRISGSGTSASDVRDALKFAVQSAMLNFADTMHILDDLKVRIVRNLTDQPFITSDDPAVLTNRLYIQRVHKVMQGFGVGAAGTIFLLPVSPQLCAIVYDSAVYHIAPQTGFVDLVRNADVDAINEHQILNCMANLYYREWDRRDQLMQQVIGSQPLRPERRHTVVQAVLDRTTEWGNRYVVKDVVDPRAEEILLHVKSINPTPSAWPSFLKFRANAKAYSNNTGTGLTRNWCLEQGFVSGSGYKKVRF